MLPRTFKWKYRFYDFLKIYFDVVLSEIKIHPGLSATDTDQVNIIGGKYTNYFVYVFYHYKLKDYIS